EQVQESPQVASLQTNSLTQSERQASVEAKGIEAGLVTVHHKSYIRNVFANAVAADAGAEAPKGNGKPNGSNDGEDGAGEDDEEKIDLEPQSLKLNDKEIKHMKELTPLIGRSPRSVKRFLNCYRLIKVGMRPAQLKTFMGEDGQSGEYEAVMILLGVITGSPSISLYFIEELEKYSKMENPGSLQSFLDKLDKNPEIHSQPDWPRVKEFLESHVRLGEDSVKMFSTLIAITPRVSRYSFRVARVETARTRKSQTK